jgi:hypothetical protein
VRTLFLLDKCRPIISGAVPTIDLPDDELAAVTAAIRGLIEGDRYPHAPRLDPLRAALARLDAAAAANAAPGSKNAKENNGAQSHTAANAAPASSHLRPRRPRRQPRPTSGDKRAARVVQSVRL